MGTRRSRDTFSNMAYSFRHRDASVEAGIRRIASYQLRQAIAEIDAPDDGLHESIHDARKRVKKLRGLLRLVRPALEIYAEENAHLRDAARELSDLRDATALLETLDRLAARHSDRLDGRRIAPLRRQFEARREAASKARDLGDRMHIFRGALSRTLTRIGDWKLDADGWDAIGPGLAKTYGRGRDAMRLAHKTGTGPDFHEWRKRVKYHGYHARLLKRIWPRMLKPHAKAVSRLGDILGEQHDLVVFQPILPTADLKPETLHLLEEVAAEERLALEARALTLGPRVFTDAPGALSRRWGAWWRIWRADPAPGGQEANSPASAASISEMLSSIP